MMFLWARLGDNLESRGYPGERLLMPVLEKSSRLIFVSSVSARVDTIVAVCNRRLHNICDLDWLSSHDNIPMAKPSQLKAAPGVVVHRKQAIKAVNPAICMCCEYIGIAGDYKVYVAADIVCACLCNSKPTRYCERCTSSRHTLITFHIEL